MNWFAIAVPALVMATALASPGFAANSVTLKNSGPAPVQIGFDRGAAQTIAPRATAAVNLNAGQHTAQQGGSRGQGVGDRHPAWHRAAPRCGGPALVRSG